MSFRIRCGFKFNRKGYHRAVCSIAGHLSERAIPFEVVMARIYREQTDAFLRGLNIAVPVIDNRRIDVIANSTSSNGGGQIAIDAAMVPILRDDKNRRPRAPEGRVVASRVLRNPNASDILSWMLGVVAN